MDTEDIPYFIKGHASSRDRNSRDRIRNWIHTIYGIKIIKINTTILHTTRESNVINIIYGRIPADLHKIPCVIP